MKNLFQLLAFLLVFSNVHAQNALQFDGIDDLVQTTFPGVLGTTNRTFEAWVYVGAGLSTSQAILDYGQNVAGSRNTFIIGGGYSLQYIAGGTNTNIFSASNVVPQGQWSHVAFVLNSGTGYLYVNGVEVGTGNLSGVNTPSGNTNLRIGQRVPGGTIPFAGAIDEVRIWNVARTQADIAANMNSEFCILPTGLVAYYKFNQGTATGNNTGLNTLTEEVSGNNGSLQNFALLGANSNWVAGASIGAGWIPGANLVESACNSYTSPSGMVLTTSGIYSDTLPSSIGCDSVLTIQLTINTVDNSVTQNGTLLTAQQSGASYQWLNCNTSFSAISGATSQSYTATTNGNYAVRIEANGCVDTSACTLVSGIGLDESSNANFQVFPNPSNGIFVVQLSEGITVELVRMIDLSGKEVYKKAVESSRELVIDTQLKTGIYLVEIQTKGKVYRQKVVVQ